MDVTQQQNEYSATPGASGRWRSSSTTTTAPPSPPKLQLAGWIVIPISAGQFLQNGVSVIDGSLSDQDRRGCGVSGIDTLRGRHNWQNAAAPGPSHGVGHRPGGDRSGVPDLQGLPHRLKASPQSPASGSSTTRRRPTEKPPHRLCPRSTIFTGSPAVSPRKAACHLH